MKIVDTKEIDLRELLKQANLSIRKLSQEAKVTRWTIHSALNGKSVMSEKTWEKIKKVLNNR